LADIAKDDAHAAMLVTERVLQIEQNIITIPKAGRYDKETDTFDRSVPKTRLVLTYAIREEIIWIIAVWHTSRDPDDKPKRTI